MSTTTTAASDAAIRERILRTLALLGPIDSTRIDITVVDGEVTLHGSVRCWSEWHTVEQLAWSTTPVKAVHNDLVIAYQEEQS